MHEECGIEAAVEDKAWSFLKNRCELLLKLYPTTKQVSSLLFGRLLLLLCSRVG